MRIRAGRVEDAAGIVDVLIHAWEDSYRGIYPQRFFEHLDAAQYERFYEMSIADDLETVFIAEDEGKIVGFASGGPDRSGKYDAEIIGLYVLPLSSGQGAGKLLFCAAVEHLLREGGKSLIVRAVEASDATGFYKKMGGKPTEYMTMQIGGKNLPSVGFVWDDMAKIAC